MVFESVATFVRMSKEYQEWGYNLFTFIFLGIVVETVWLLWGLWHQNKTLWDPTRKSAEGMAILPRFLYVTFYVLGFFYSLQLMSIGLATALPLGLMQLGILLGLWRIEKKLTPLEWLVAIGSVPVVVIGSTPRFTAFVYGVVAYVLVATCIAQPVKMWRNKSAEGMNWREPATAILSTGMWVVFGVLIGSLLISSFSLALLIIFSTNLYLYYRFTPSRMPAGSKSTPRL
jgi:uncharacterized protein with PQ loop repeat